MRNIKNTLENSPMEQDTANDAGSSAIPTQQEVQEAVRTMIKWAGEDPAREGLIETPKRVAIAFREFFAGYEMSAEEILGKTFEEYGDYADFVHVRNIDFVSHCEHHMVPIIGKAHVAYWPNDRVVGISKLARTVDVFAKRLTMQEKMTAQIAGAIDEFLKPKGTAVVIDAVHHCMSARGVCKPGASTVTSKFTGVFETDESARRRFLDQIAQR